MWLNDDLFGMTIRRMFSAMPRSSVRLAVACVLILISACTTKSSAQGNSGFISGSIIDSATKSPVAYATVSVFRSADTALITYRLSDEKGRFKVSGIPLNVRSYVVISYLGKNIFKKELNFSGGTTGIEIGSIPLKEGNNLLNEVLVRAEAAPVVVRKDTIEFNASAFKTLPNALVEDLLKKLPGVSVDAAGNITVNGRRVTTIYVDGKDFFGGKVRIATRNLPSNIIDKVEVYNNQSELARNPFLNEADIPQVINLKLKPNIKKGAFGKVYAGMGNNDRFEAGTVLNLFRDTTQVSLIGYGNNLNRAGFGYEDLSSLGGFDRSGSDTYRETDNGGLVINDISFGGTGEGEQKSAGGGANFNTLTKNKVKLNLQYFYGSLVSRLEQIANIQQAYGNTELNTARNQTLAPTNYNHNLGGRIQFKAFNYDVDYRPSLSVGSALATQVTNTTTSTNGEPTLNNGTNNQNNQNNTIGYSSVLIANRNFKKRGRYINLYNVFSVGNINADQRNDALNSFSATSSVSALNQLRSSKNAYLSEHTSIRYTEPITQSLTLTTDANIDFFDSKATIATYEKDPNGGFSNINEDLSETYLRRGLRDGLSAGVRWRRKGWTITPSMGVQALFINNSFTKHGTIKQSLFYLQPRFSVYYGVFSFTYNNYFTEPTMSQLQPIVDNSDPLFITLGNPALKPTFTNNFAFRARQYDKTRAITYSVFVNANIESHSIVYSRTIDTNGVQTIRPVNTDKNWNIENRLSLQKDIKTSDNFQLSLITSNYLRFSNSMFILNSTGSRSRSLKVNPAVEFRLNLRDVFELNQVYSLSSTRSSYSNIDFADRSINSYSLKNEVVLRLPKNIVWETSLDYQNNSNNIPGIRPYYYKWNAGLTYVLTKSQRATVKLSVNDLLNQNVNAYRSVRENYTEDVQTNSLKRFWMLTFNYNIGSFGGKVGGRNQLLKF